MVERERERENLFAKSDNNIASNISQYTMAGCQGSIYPSMLAAYDKKTIIANVTKEGKIQKQKHTYKVQSACAKQGASK